MDKKLYFLNIDILDNLDCNFNQLTDEEWIRHSEFVYDSIEEYCADFNTECAPSYTQYFVRCL